MSQTNQKFNYPKGRNANKCWYCKSKLNGKVYYPFNCLKHNVLHYVCEKCYNNPNSDYRKKFPTDKIFPRYFG